MSLRVRAFPGALTRGSERPAWGEWPASSRCEWIKALVRIGWFVDRASGTSHHQPITVPVKKGRMLKKGTARAILRQAGISEDEFFQVY